MKGPSKFPLLSILLLLFSCGIPGLTEAQSFDFLTCNCNTTADFSAYADSIIYLRATEGKIAPGQVTYTLTISSTAVPETAYVQVLAIISKGQFGVYTADILSTTPVDSTGNSIADLTEQAKQALRAIADIDTYGTSRSNPLVLPKGTFGTWAFQCNSGNAVCDDLDWAFWTSHGFSAVNTLEAEAVANSAGFYFTVTDQYGDTALYVLTYNSSTKTYTLTWQGYATDQNKNRINRDGSILIPAPKGTPGTTQTVPTVPPGPPGGPNYYFNVTPLPNCQWETQIMITDASGNVSSGGFYPWILPCPI